MFPDRTVGWSDSQEERNPLPHCYFLLIEESGAPETPQKILVIKHDLSRFVELISCREEADFVVSEALLDWYKRFGLALYHVSDQGAHFKNRIVSYIGESHKDEDRQTWWDPKVSQDILPLLRIDRRNKVRKLMLLFPYGYLRDFVECDVEGNFFWNCFYSLLGCTYCSPLASSSSQATIKKLRRQDPLDRGRFHESLLICVLW